MFEEDFAGRVLPFDSDAARFFAKIAAARRVSGRPLTQFGAQIAAIARVHHAVVATRNGADFENCGVPVLNPWSEQPVDSERKRARKAHYIRNGS